MTALFSPKVDYIFKKIFGSEAHPQILISFLNACLKNDVIIKSVKINNTEMTKEFIENNFSRLDILATTSLGEVINIEMQRADEKNMVKRSLYYWSKAFTNSYAGKSEYEKLPRTVCINILDFKLLDEIAFHNTYLLYNKKNKNLLIDTLELHFIELPKLSDNNEIDELSSWANFINDPDSPQALDAEIKMPILHEARTELARLSRDPKEAELYRQRQNAISDKNNALLAAAKQGKIEGMKEGEVKGVERVAKTLKQNGVDAQTISQSTGLTIDQIRKL